MTDAYQNIAALYNRLFSKALRGLRQDIRTYIFHRKYRNVIDICCGTGEQLALLERPGMQLSGIDNSPSMLEQARQCCDAGTEFHFLDADSNVFSHGSYDCAIISLSLHEKNRVEATSIFKNACNIVREKGSIIIADYSPFASTLWGRLVGKIVIPLIEKCAGSEHHQNYLQWMKAGGLEGFLSQHNQEADIISRPLHGTVLCCSVEKLESTIEARQSFGLLDYYLPKHSQLSGNKSNEPVR